MYFPRDRRNASSLPSPIVHRRESKAMFSWLDAQSRSSVQLSSLDLLSTTMYSKSNDESSLYVDSRCLVSAWAQL